MNRTMSTIGERTVDALGAIVGRRLLVRASRFVLDRARLDVRNDIVQNGERWIIAETLRHIKSATPTHVIDVGANLGDWTAEVLRCAGDNELTVHAFEPVPKLHSMLEQRFTHESRVRINQLAAGDVMGRVPMFVSSGISGTSSIVAPSQDVSHEVQVGVTTLDEYCRTRSIVDVALVKTDTEGNDLAVALGAENLLRDGRIGLHQFEYNHRWIGARTYLRDAFTYFEQFGYQVAKVTPRGAEFYPRWTPELETFKEANFVAVHPHLVPLLPKIRWWNLDD